mgnify:CR=1 FL=1
MSLQLPVVNVSKYQRFGYVGYEQQVEFRFFDNSLYICKVEGDGSVLHGAEVRLDELPAAAIYGDNGSVQALLMSGELTLNFNYDSLEQSEKDTLNTALVQAIAAKLNNGGMVTSLTVNGAKVLLEGLQNP